MTPAPTHTRGFTLIELLVVVAVLLTLASIAVPAYRDAVERAKAARCLTNRHYVEQAERQYYLDQQTPSLALERLVDKGYLTTVPRCPSGGEYLWIVNDPTNPYYPLLGCTYHYWAEPPGADGGNGGTTTLFLSDFSTLDGLTPLSGIWEIHDGVLVPAGGWEEHRLAFGDEDWTDYHITVNATITDGMGYGIYYRADGRPDITGYIFQYDPGLGDRFVVRKVYGGYEQPWFEGVRMADGFPVFGQSHQVVIRVQGTHHVITVDGEVVLEFDDDAFASGVAGFRSWHHSQVGFEDVEVAALE